MKNKIKTLLLYIKYQYKSTSELYIKYLRKKGIKIGSNTHFYSPWTISVDTIRPWMVEIGDNVHITAGCTILEHGYDWSVLHKLHGEVLGSSGKVKIGNNIFIGQKSTILKGVTVGDNVIIGANSVVTKDLPSNGVYAGNPAKFIMSIDEYYEKRRNLQLEEATSLMTEYYKKYNKYPPKELLREFFWLFENNYNNLNLEFKNVLNLQGNGEFSKEVFKHNKKKFKDYDDFIKYVDSINHKISC